MKTDPEMIQVIELADKDSQTIIISIFYALKTEKREHDMEDIQKFKYNF